ncbi:hypothetical protein SAMN02746041_03025 [Desulfacinum hydrothermale DSM 13146]|uniref:Uncharacterized protein n=1 Tax=Desulfacinum hydrothermale DSM 13146 TaxID=1121390 RepID=A0A1W1XUK3_9BACT|nr:hypothetical protein [Desulfacinum hydrothermale]SMC23197.1 hypothetical protein SAMN02746041_01686 [Desulfacinum hydrothermale DSM 13146]SMC27639.1 hypothetical protein SAMN02746041_03025 [Desulfacinum hydrothermale DSM 13146]
MIALNPTVQDAMLQAVADAIDAGSPSPGLIRIYDGTAPDPPGADVTTQTLLAELTCSLPCGTVADGTLTLSPIAEEGNAPATGTAGWARIVDGAGAWVADLDVGTTGSGAAIELNAVEIYQGGIVRITQATLSAV